MREDKESSQSSVITRQSFTSHLELKLGAKEQVLASGELKLEEVVVPGGSIEIANILDKILDTSYENSSFEGCKLKAYIRECWDVQSIDDEFPTGVHPDRYQEFVGGMAQYIVDKQLLLQRESLSYDMVYVSYTFICSLIAWYLCTPVSICNCSGNGCSRSLCVQNVVVSKHQPLEKSHLTSRVFQLKKESVVSNT